MKKLFIIISILSLFIITSCKKNNQQTSDVDITIEYGEGFDNVVINSQTYKNNYDSLIKETTYKKVTGFKDESGSSITKDFNPTANVKIIAVWETKKYTYSFYNGDELILTKTADAGSTIEYPEDLEPKTIDSDYYVFKGWDKDIKELTYDVNINAVFEKQEKEFTYIFYDSDRTTILGQGSGVYGTKITYPETPSDKEFEGYKLVFKAWRGAEEYLTEDLKIYAQYSRVNNTYTVTYYDYDNKVYDVQEIEYQDYAVEIEDPIKETFDENTYYRFDGWYTSDNKPYDFNEYITSNLSLYPKNEYGPYGTTELKDATISILGDSISTFYSQNSEVNSFYAGTNQYYYPIYSNSVKSAEQTWWYKTILNLGAKLGVNNSLSGSAAYGVGTTPGQSPSRLKTLNNKGTANIVWVFLGTNDNVNGHTVENIESAFRAIIEYIQENCIENRNGIYIKPIIYLFCAGYSAYSGYNYTEERRIAFNNVLVSLANEYENVRTFDIGEFIDKDNYNFYLGDSLHYNSTGMNLVAEKLTERLTNDFKEENIIENKNEVKQLKYNAFITNRRKEEFE